MPHPVLGPAGVYFQGPEGVRSATTLKLECGVNSQEKLSPGGGGQRWGSEPDSCIHRSRILASGGSVPSFVKQGNAY